MSDPVAEYLTLKERLATLEAARQSGAARVTYGGRTVEYRSLADLDQLIADLEAQIVGIESGTTTTLPSIRQVRLVASKGV